MTNSWRRSADERHPRIACADILRGVSDAIGVHTDGVPCSPSWPPFVSFRTDAPLYEASEDIRPDLVAHQFLEILKATSSEDQEQLETIVPRADYRNVFLKLSRNLAPTGKTFDSIEFRTATSEIPIALTPEARAAINQTLKKNQPVDAQDSQGTEEELIGILRAVDLDKDFLDVTVNGQAVHVAGLGDAMDDVIGPMVNKTVKVLAIRRASGPLRFRDIELDE